MPTNRPSRMERNHKKPDKVSDKPEGKSKRKKKISGKMIIWTSFFTIAVAVICGIVGYLFITVNGEKLLDANKDKLQVNAPTQVFDRSGKLMGELSLETSDPVDSSEIPKLLKNAFVATEDRRFYEHSGVDFWSIGRAAVKDVVARSMVEGGSTITQQLAKNIFLSRDKTFFRKATEMSIAMALERQYTKDEILTMYLNRIPFGGTTYGIKAASEKYFGISDLNKLDIWQIATLAAMPKGPSKYNPLRNPEASTERRAVVLELMYEQGFITAEQRDHAKAVVYDYQPPASKQSYPAFIDYVMDEAEDVAPQLTEDELVRGGYKIYTTMDVTAQKAVEQAFADDDNFEKSKDDQPVQAAMMIMNHDNGSIVALLGGRDYERKGFSRINSRRQPGSSLKPVVVYAPALESGQFTMDSELNNEKQCFNDYCPSNLHGYSKTMGMTEAITKSENIPAVWLLNQIGVKTGISYAKKMGITLDSSDNNLAIALGGLTKGTNVKEMAEAYSVFANQGKFNEAYSIKQIVDEKESVVYQHGSPEQKQVLSEQTAYEMTEMLEHVISDGTGKQAKLDRPLAGKTGTTQHGIPGLKSSKNRDAWFVGYTPEWTAAVWMGYDKPDKNHLLNGSSGEAAALFGKVMSKALAGVPVKDFQKPADMVEPSDEPSDQPVAGPANLHGSFDNSTGTVTLSWDGVAQEGGEYHIYRKASTEQDFTSLMNVMTTDAEDLSVVPGESYQYYVTYFDPETSQESVPSNTAQVDVPAGETPPSDSGQPSSDQPPPTETPEPPPSGNETLPPTDNQGNPGGSTDTGSGTDNGNGNPGGSGTNGDQGTGNPSTPGGGGDTTGGLPVNPDQGQQTGLPAGTTSNP